MEQLSRVLCPDGRWLFADCWPVEQPPPLWQRLLLWSMYNFFGIFSQVKARRLPDYALHFRQLGFAEKFSDGFYHGLVQAKVYRRVPGAES